MNKFLLFLSVLLIALPCYSQSYVEMGSQAVINYTPKEYNANQTNWAIMQDEHGIMYFGNGQGLLEFDGSTWRLYQVPNKSTVRSLANGSDGKIYAGAQADLGYFLPDSSGQLTFHSLINFIPKDKRDFSDVWETYVSNGNVYFDTGNYLLIWDINKKEFKIIKSENGIHFTALINGKLYAREFGKGFEVLKNDSLTLVKDGEKFANERIYVMLPFPGEKGTSLIVTRTMGFYKYNGIDFIPFKSEVDQFIKDNLIYLPGEILLDGKILLGTLNGGAVVIDTAGHEVRRYSNENGIYNAVRFTFQDRSGAVWLATDNGISRIDYTSPINYFDSRNNFTTSARDIIRHNGIIYTATSNGVYFLDANTSMFHLLKNSNNTSWYFAEIGSELLVGTFDGLFKVEKDKLTPIRKTVGNEYNVNFLKQSRLNPDRVYVATRSGLWSVLKTGNTWRDEGQILDNSDQPITLVEDKDGSVWISTYSSGIFRVTFQKDDKGNIILNKPVIEHFDKTNGLQSGYTDVSKISGVNYFNTVDSIYIFDENKKMFYTDTSDKFISAYYELIRNNTFSAFQQDNLGRMWIGYKGKLAMGTLQSDSSWKWVSSPFNSFADVDIYKVYAEKNGVTWFGTTDGIIKYNFGKKNLGSTNYAALVRKVEIGEDSTIYFGGKLGNPVTPEITYKNNSVTLRYAATSYEGKIVNQFKTFLDGFDDGWSQYSTETKKEYTNLPPGKYTFKVAALNLAGTESSTGTYSFEILPPWYRTWWAYIFYVMVLAAGIFAVDRIQRRRLVKKERERAEIERKTGELEEARKLQLSMLPKDVPRIPHLDIAVYMQTATEVGGDYYDFSIKDDGSVNICVGDATGHGMKAGTIVTMMKSLFVANSSDKSIEEFFASTNAAIKNSNLARMLAGFAMLNISDHKAKYLNAGMPSIYHFKKNDGEVEEIEKYNLPLGAMKTGKYNSTELFLDKSDVILMMSDGFPEMHNSLDELFGYERVYSSFEKVTEKEPNEIIKHLIEESLRWSQGKELHDDVTFVVIKMK